MASITFGKNGTRPYCVLTVTEQSQNIPNNTSTVSWSLVLVRPSNVASSATKTWSVTINGTKYNGSGSIGGSGNKTLLSGTQVIGHNADGTKTISFSGQCQLDLNWGGTWIGTISGSGSMALTRIPRYATVSQSLQAKTETSISMSWSSDATVDYIWYSTNNGSTWTGIDVADGLKGSYTISGLSANTTYQIKTRVRRKDSQLTTDSSALGVTTYAFPYANSTPNFTIGERLTIGLFNPLGRTVTITLIGADNSQITVDSTNGTSITGYAGETIINRLYASIPSSMSGVYKVKVGYGTNVTTTNGGTYTVNSNVCSPSIGAVEYEDINQATIALTENDQDIVQNHSVVKYTASTLTALKSASIASCSVTVNGQTYPMTISGSSATGGNAVIDSGTDLDAVVTLTDSRGLTVSKSITVSMIAWSNPTAIISLARQHNYYSETDIKVDANYADINGNNQITITYQATEDTPARTVVSGTLQDNVASVINLDNIYAWSVVVTLTDSLGGTATYNMFISRGMPIIYFDRIKSSVGVNCFPSGAKTLEVDGDIYLNGEPIADFIVESGTSGDWAYRKYASGNVELDGQFEVDSANITWNAYLSTGLVYGNTRIQYPFNITDAIINATLDYAGGSVGWVSTAHALDNTQTSVTMVRNGQTGTMRINLHVHGSI